MIDLKPFRKGQAVEEWLEKLSRLLEDNPWLEKLLNGQMVPKNEKSTFTMPSDLVIAGGITAGGTVTGGDLISNDDLLVTDQAVVLGWLGIGVNPPLANLHVSASGGGADIMTERASNDSAANDILYSKARGTVASKSAVQANDDLGTFSYRGYDGTAYRPGVWLRGVVDGTPGSNDMPGRFEILTTPDGSATPTIRVTVKQDGKVGIGNVSPNALLDVQGSAIFNDAGADVDFRIEGDANTQLFWVDASADAIGVGTSAPDAKSILHLDSTTRVFLPVRMTTTQRDAITSPPEGGVVYNLTDHQMNYYNGTTWVAW